MSGDRPSGTVTFLFTDIEGSTKRWESDPDVMRVELASHDDVLRAAVEDQGGWLFKHTGDGVCAAFQSARSAVDAAIDAQRRLRLPVRMGIATGEAEVRGEDYFGPVLNLTARVMDVGSWRPGVGGGVDGGVGVGGRTDRSRIAEFARSAGSGADLPGTRRRVTRRVPGVTHGGCGARESAGADHVVHRSR